VSSGPAPADDGRLPGSGPSQRGGSQGQSGIATAITEVTERASLLIREEIELAKTEIAEKTTRLAKGAVVAIVAGVFFLTALFFVLIGCAWLLYYALPIGGDFTYFWGFFAMALILVVLGALAGLLAAKAVKSGSPPVPAMAIEEARKIRETVSSSSDAGRAPASFAESASSESAPTPPPLVPPVPPAAPAPAAPASPAPGTPVGHATTAPSEEMPAGQDTPAETPSDGNLGRGTIDGTTHGG
jgi:hypothetical protein